MRRILTAGLIAASVIGLAACSDWGSSGSSRNAPAAESNGYSSGAGTSYPAGIPGQQYGNGSVTGNQAGSNTGYGSSAPDHNSGPNTQYQVH
jgi:hypothetical protein